MSCADRPASTDRPSSSRRPRVLCAGITVHDYVYRLDAFPPPGAKQRAREFRSVLGGCAANAAVAVVRLGGEATLASPLGGPAGTDAIGDMILAGVGAEGVDGTACVRVDGAVSPLSAILVDAAGERMIVNHRDEALSSARIADPHTLVAGFDAVLADNRFADFVLPLLVSARARGLPAVLDGDRPTQASDALLTAASHIVFAADGLRATAGCEALEEALLRIAAVSEAFLAVTDGANGVLWLDGGNLRHMQAHAVAVVDTLAAGDVFHGAFALSLAGGSTIEAALGFGNAAAGLKCTRFGGGGGAPTAAEVAAFLAAR